MIELSEIIASTGLLRSPLWDTCDFPLTLEGLDSLRMFLESHGRNGHQLYVLTDSQSEVLRIGSAKNGTFERWVNATNGHFSTIEWSLGFSHRYGEKNAMAYAKYLVFFKKLEGQELSLSIANCESTEANTSAMLGLEELLIAHFLPAWESFSKDISSHQPRIYGAKKDKDTVTAIVNREYDAADYPVLRFEGPGWRLY